VAEHYSIEMIFSIGGTRCADDLFIPASKLIVSG